MRRALATRFVRAMLIHPAPCAMSRCACARRRGKLLAKRPGIAHARAIRRAMAIASASQPALIRRPRDLQIVAAAAGLFETAPRAAAAAAMADRAAAAGVVEV